MASTSALTHVSVPAFDFAAYAVAEEAYRGLTSAPKNLAPWLFYDEAGSHLFEQITRLPEYYLTRTERALFAAHSSQIFDLCATPLTVVELGAGTAAKTGVLLEALGARQNGVLYHPIDISPSALDEASASLAGIHGLTIAPTIANYLTDSIRIDRAPDTSVLALYIGSSIGNFSPRQARAILQNLRVQLKRGDHLLLGTDLAPSLPNGRPGKSVSTLLAAYNDAAGVTAAFNRNVLRRLNRQLHADFRNDHFRHCALWNAAESRIEMHLQSTCAQTVRIPANPATPALTLRFAPGETIHTENSHKFTSAAIRGLLGDSGFVSRRTFIDAENLFAVTLAQVL